MRRHAWVRLPLAVSSGTAGVSEGLTGARSAEPAVLEQSQRNNHVQAL